jgi:hypothetical protein
LFNYCRARTIGAEDQSDTIGKGSIYPIQALVTPVSLRFKYHFEGTRETNRLDKVRCSTIIIRLHRVLTPPSLSGISLISSISRMSTANSWMKLFNAYFRRQNTKISMHGYVALRSRVLLTKFLTAINSVNLHCTFYHCSHGKFGKQSPLYCNHPLYWRTQFIRRWLSMYPLLRKVFSYRERLPWPRIMKIPNGTE